MTRPRYILLGVIAAVIAALTLWRLMRFPPDSTPRGAYMRIARAVSGGEPREAFAYLEQDAQHAAFSVVDYARKASGRIEQTYPDTAKSQALAPYVLAASCADGPQLWVRLAEQRGWIRRLRRDLSGIADVEVVGERATVVTVRGTRYPFRRRPNGIWGLTIFTAELSAEAERMARNWDLIQQDAADYERAGADPRPQSSSR